MDSPLANRTYRRLFAAQVVALLGTGLSTVALSLLAYQIAGGDAGAVLGTALALKMVAYVAVAPIVGGFAHRRAYVERLALAWGFEILACHRENLRREAGEWVDGQLFVLRRRPVGEDSPPTA